MMTLMETEARQAPDLIAASLRTAQPVLQEIATRLHNTDVPCVMTLARGSSDHAATYAKYLFETQLSLPTASAAPSVFTLYRKKLQLKNGLVIAISQSGQSVDLHETLRAARESGAITIAIVNDPQSPLARTAEYVLPLDAGKENAVAATKSYLASLSMLLALTAAWTENPELCEALEKLPDFMHQALSSDWSHFVDTFAEANTAIVTGRGFSFSIAQEAALKFKETCGLQAEAFSSAEILHGPLALIRDNYQVLMFAQADQALPGTLALAEKIQSLGGKTLLALPQGQLADTPPWHLPLPKALHPVCDPIVAMQAFYPAMARLSQQRGCDPDNPPNLQKITITT